GVQLLNAGFEIVLNDPHGFNALAGGVSEFPVFVAFARKDRTGVTAAHGDDHIRGLDRFGSQDSWGGRGDVNAVFGHGGHGRWVELISGGRPGGADLDAALTELPEVSGGHLGATGVVDTYEQHRGLVGRSRMLGVIFGGPRIIFPWW